MESGQRNEVRGATALTSLSPKSTPQCRVNTPECIMELSQGYPCRLAYGTSRCFVPARWSPCLPHTDWPMLAVTAKDCHSIVSGTQAEFPTSHRNGGVRCPPSPGGLPKAHPRHTPTPPTHAHNRQNPPKLCVLPISASLTMGYEAISASVDTNILVVWRSELLDAPHTHRMGPLCEKPDR